MRRVICEEGNSRREGCSRALRWGGGGGDIIKRDVRRVIL